MGVSGKNVSKTDTDTKYLEAAVVLNTFLIQYKQLMPWSDPLFWAWYTHATDAVNIGCLNFLSAHFSRYY